MNVYLVGGAVRDNLLGKAIHERDYVVVGATPAEMLELGYRQVGKDFPVFLHPETNEEYALARTERKSGRGYTGFVIAATPKVTLEQDLERRDLTINAIAQADDGELIDPYGGVDDIDARIIRHVSPAFVEDPLRVLRAARFAARFANDGFVVADETLALMQEISAADELSTLANERVWVETVKALSTTRADVYFEVLRRAQALRPWFPELTDEKLFTRVVKRLKNAKKESADIKFGLWMGEHEEADVDAICARLKVPNEWTKLGQLSCQWHPSRHSLTCPRVFCACLQQADCWRRPERFEKLTELWHQQGLPESQQNTLKRAFQAATDISASDLITQAANRGEQLRGPAIGAAVQDAREQVIATVLNKESEE
ncbi:Multifunctional CCA protein [Pseudidiomarina piscicola]|uniref:Multifunctional CCA protein n=1 Tax=Pseudidiomarina piscicola TaxID=2614830 RepID=A0A6S6WQZ7_9GAMM|nr:hypothetical protein [Pseudidiomarina piscicola]CAB0151942.1 Multifunctional CCA protein [Pseudidiomarina piscicola]VZT41381.1 Multifunctional CCA protein [Pseudomonas aeruginosa]